MGLAGHALVLQPHAGTPGTNKGVIDAVPGVAVPCSQAPGPVEGAAHETAEGTEAVGVQGSVWVRSGRCDGWGMWFGRFGRPTCHCFKPRGGFEASCRRGQ